MVSLFFPTPRFHLINVLLIEGCRRNRSSRSALDVLYSSTYSPSLTRSDNAGAQPYRERKLSTPQLRAPPGLRTRYELDGFLKAHEVWLEYGVEDLQRDREAHGNLGLQLNAGCTVRYVAQPLFGPDQRVRIAARPRPPPDWLEVVPPSQPSDPQALPHFDVGEGDAILLALEIKADLVLMDEREGVEEATRLGLTVTATLGVLDRAAEKGLLDLPGSGVCAQRTFGFHPPGSNRLLGDDARRKGKA